MVDRNVNFASNSPLFNFPKIFYFSLSRDMASSITEWNIWMLYEENAMVKLQIFVL